MAWPNSQAVFLLAGGRMSAVLVFSVLVSACASVPVETLRSYSTAYQQVQIAGDLLLDEIAPFVTAAGESNAGQDHADTKAQNCSASGAAGYPPCFDPATALGAAEGRTAEDPDIAARRAALATVAQYNGLLLALAEGQSSADVEQRFDELTDVVGAAALLTAPFTGGATQVLSAAAPLFKELAGRFEQARANSTVRQSLAASESDIRDLFELLIADTPSIYAIYVRGQELALVRLNKAKNVARLAKDRALHAHFETEVAARKQQISDFHASVGAYTRLLAAAEDSLTNLVSAVKADPVTVENAASVTSDAANVKAKAEAFLILIRAVRTPVAVAGTT